LREDASSPVRGRGVAILQELQWRDRCRQRTAGRWPLERPRHIAS